MNEIKYAKVFIDCKTEQEFKEVWNSSVFNWKYFSDYLCQYYHKYFNIWWDSEKFNWDYADYLQKYCQKYKHIWKKDYIKWKLKNI